MQHSKMKIAPAIIGYIGITGHTIKVKIPKRFNAPGVLTDLSTLFGGKKSFHFHFPLRYHTK